MGQRSLRIRSLALLAAFLAGSVLSLWVHAPGTVGDLLWRLELVTYDWRLRTRARDRPASEDIVIVAVDTNSLITDGYGAWPWPRSRHAQLIDFLSEAGARVILMDILFDRPSDPEQDAELAAAIERAGNVVLTSEIISERTAAVVAEQTLQPIEPLLKAAAGTGISLLPEDWDGTVRRIKLSWVIPGGDEEVGYFSGLVAAALAEGQRPEAYYEKWAPYLRPNHDWMEGADLLIDYRASPPAGYQYYSYANVLEGEVPAEAFAGKVVLVGMRSGLEPDLKLHPMGVAAETRDELSGQMDGMMWLTDKMAGVEAIAHVTDMLLERRAIVPIGVQWGRLLPMLYAVAVALTVAFYRFRGGVVAAVGLLLCQWYVASLVFVRYGVWIPEVSVGLAILGSYAAGASMVWVLEERTAAFLRRAWERRVSPEVLDQILAHPELRNIPSRRVGVTVVFIDLAGFTSMSAETDPVRIVGYLNRYMTLASERAVAHGGVVHKFIGDGIMMAFGEPVEIGNHAQCAVDWAFDFQAAMTQLRDTIVSEGGPALHARVGVHSGDVIAGDIGPERLLEYTIVGSAVNLASRLEGLNKRLGTTICVSAETHGRLEDARGLVYAGAYEVAGYPVAVDVYTDRPPEPTQ